MPSHISQNEPALAFLFPLIGGLQSIILVATTGDISAFVHNGNGVIVLKILGLIFFPLRFNYELEQWFLKES